MTGRKTIGWAGAVTSEQIRMRRRPARGRADRRPRVPSCAVRARASATLPLYVGGFIGPFGGAVIAVLLPQLRDGFYATPAPGRVAIPAYLVPFAVFQLVSGTIGERLGRRRV